MSKIANDWFFVNPQERGFGEWTEADEKQHFEANAEVSAPALIETQYLGFSVPEAAIHSINYAWLHPNVGSASAGTLTWQGLKPSQLHSELIEMRDHWPIEAVGDMDNYTLPNSYSVEVVKPGEELHISYEDPTRDNAFDVTFKAIMPPAMLPSGKHFEQGMKTSGTLRLRGEDHVVDGFSLRDKSWAEARPEDALQLPPVAWICPFFDEDFAVHAVALDDPDHDPLWKEVYDTPKEQVDAIARGWVWKDGELNHLTEVSLQTDWDRSTGYPRAHRMDVVDSSGKSYTLTGETIAANRWYVWSNGYFPLTLMRWECDGKVGYGEVQIGTWTDFVRLLEA